MKQSILSKAIQARINPSFGETDEHSDAFFRGVANHTPALLRATQKDGLCTFFNTSWLNFTGRTLEQERGFGWMEGMHPDDHKGYLERYSQLLISREPYEVTYRLRRHDGDYRWMLERASPNFEHGAFCGYIGSLTDITDLYIANAALEQKNQDLAAAILRADTISTNFMAALMAAPAGMLMIDYSGKIILVNEHIENLFGYSASELYGQSVEIFLPSETAEKHRMYRKNYLSDPIMRPMGEGRDLFGIHKDGTKIPIEIGLSPVSTSEGNFIISSVIDISMHKKNEEHLRKLASTLEKSNEELENFAYLASHDLQAPMRSIVSFAGLIKEQLANHENEETIRYLDIMCKSARDMKALLQALLAYSRVGGKKEINFIPVNLNDLVAHVIEENFSNADPISITYHELPVVEGDPLLLKHLFANLLSNALKFRKPQTSALVSISGLSLENKWRITIADQGIGMDPQFIGRAFAIFSREDGTQNVPGTGIGLAICKKIASMHKAEIWCESQRGKGTTFYFDLPKG